MNSKTIEAGKRQKAEKAASTKALRQESVCSFLLALQASQKAFPTPKPRPQALGWSNRREHFWQEVKASREVLEAREQNEPRNSK